MTAQFGCRLHSNGRSGADARPSAARLSAFVAFLFLAGIMGGCTSTLARLPGIGEPEAVPPAPETSAAYPAVHDMPPPRETKPISAEARKELAEELTAVRDQQSVTGSARPKGRPARK
jgi:hypothetical protein